MTATSRSWSASHGVTDLAGAELTVTHVDGPRPSTSGPNFDEELGETPGAQDDHYHHTVMLLEGGSYEAH